MTDLTHEEFRAACEAAGLIYLSTGLYSLPWDPEKGRFSYSWYPSDPALPTYVASLLLDRIDATHMGPQRYSAALARIACPDVERRLLALKRYGITPAQKIRAAMAVLKPVKRRRS